METQNELVLKISAVSCYVYLMFSVTLQLLRTSLSSKVINRALMFWNPKVSIYVIKNFIASMSCLAVLTKTLHDACKQFYFVQFLVRSSSIFHFSIDYFDLLSLLLLNHWCRTWNYCLCKGSLQIHALVLTCISLYRNSRQFRLRPGSTREQREGFITKCSNQPQPFS